MLIRPVIGDRVAKCAFEGVEMRLCAVVLSSLFVLTLHGCASPKAAPNLIAGRYYLAGDEYCKTARPAGQDSRGYFRIECFDKDGDSTGHRYAMSSTNLQDYHQRQAQLQVQRNAEVQALIEQMNRTSQSFNQAATAFQQQGMSFQPPTAQPIGQQGVDWWYCRDATDRIIICHR